MVTTVEALTDYITNILPTDDEFNRLTYIKSLPNFRNHNKNWNESRIGNSNNVGSMIMLTNEIKPTSWEHFVKAYFSEYMDIDHYIALTMKWNQYNNTNAPLMAIREVSAHVLYETYVGWKRENETIAIINTISQHRISCNTLKASDEIDRKYAIDAITYMDYKRVGWSIKPSSFFHSQRIQWHKDKITQQLLQAVNDNIVEEVFFLDGDDVIRRNANAEHPSEMSYIAIEVGES